MSLIIVFIIVNILLFIIAYQFIIVFIVFKPQAQQLPETQDLDILHLSQDTNICDVTAPVNQHQSYT